MPNGSTVIVLRSFGTAFYFLIGALLFQNLLDPNRHHELSLHSFSSRELRMQMLEMGHWFTAVFAGVYAALYARFSSQWSYLAGVYNQIKASECRGISNGDQRHALAQWRAAFIEDAEELHLATKPVFAAIIQTWAKKTDVEEAFARDVPDGRTRLHALVGRIEHVLVKHHPK